MRAGSEPPVPEGAGRVLRQRRKREYGRAALQETCVLVSKVPRCPSAALKKEGDTHKRNPAIVTYLFKSLKSSAIHIFSFALVTLFVLVTFTLFYINCFVSFVVLFCFLCFFFLILLTRHLCSTSLVPAYHRPVAFVHHARMSPCAQSAAAVA